MGEMSSLILFYYSDKKIERDLEDASKELEILKTPDLFH